MLATLYRIKEEDSTISAFFSFKLGFVKLNLLIYVVFWRMDMVLFKKARGVCIVVWSNIGIRV